MIRPIGSTPGEPPAASTTISAPMQPQYFENAGARRIQADVIDDQFAGRRQAASQQHEGGR